MLERLTMKWTVLSASHPHPLNAFTQPWTRPHYSHAVNHNTHVITASKGPADQCPLPIVLIALTVSLPLRMLLYASFYLHDVEEQDALQYQQQEAGQAASLELMHSTCITKCGRSAMEKELQIWVTKSSYRNWNAEIKRAFGSIKNHVNSWTGEGITVKVVRRQEMKENSTWDA